MKKISKILSIVLCLAMVLSFATMAFADGAQAVTIPEANTIGAAKEHNTYTEEKYIVSGTICEITNTQYGNLYIQDAEGNKLFVYGLYNVEGTRFDKLDPQPKVGDIVTLEGVLGQYNGNPQMKNATMTAHTVVENEEAPAPTPDPVEVTIPEAVAIGAAKEHNTFTEEKYIVSGVIVEITSDKYGNLYIQDAEGNKLFVYGMYDADGNRYDAMATKPAVGDTVTLVGVLGQYNGNAQMKNATVTAHTPAAPGEEPPVEEPPQTGDAIVMAVCGLLASGGVMAILPKKREN